MGKQRYAYLLTNYYFLDDKFTISLMTSASNIKITKAIYFGKKNNKTFADKSLIVVCLMSL